MKTRNIINRIFQLLLIMSVIIACSKDGDVGDNGPQGEQGIAGPQGDKGEPGQDGAAANQGAQGEQGEQGPKGDTGTANVIYSPWTDSGFETPIADDFGSFFVTVPELTQEVIDTGSVQVFIKDSNGDIFALPLTLYNSISDESYWIRFQNPGILEIAVQETVGNDLGNIFLDGPYRYVIIPGGNPTSGKSAIDYSKMSYEEIVERFNIPD